SSKIGLPDKDQCTSCSLAGRTTTSEKGKRADRWKPRVFRSSSASEAWSTDRRSVKRRPSRASGSHWKSSASWRETYDRVPSESVSQNQPRPLFSNSSTKFSAFLACHSRASRLRPANKDLSVMATL